MAGQKVGEPSRRGARHKLKGDILGYIDRYFAYFYRTILVGSPSDDHSANLLIDIILSYTIQHKKGTMPIEAHVMPDAP